MTKLELPVMRRAWLRAGGVSQADVARKVKLSEATVSRVLDGTYRDVTPKGQKTRRVVEDAVAELLAKPVTELFPQRRKEDRQRAAMQA